MKQTLHLLCLGLGILLMQNSHAQTSMEKILNLRNDKEVLIRSIKKGEQKRISEKFNDQAENSRIAKVFYTTIQEFLDQETKCELSLIDKLKKNFEAAKIDNSEDGMIENFKMLRVTNAIDDIFYDMLIGIHNDFNNLGGLKLTKKKLQITFKHKQLVKDNDVKELFSGFTEWPDEINRCAYSEYMFVKKHIRNEDGFVSKKDSDMRVLIKKAYKEKVIDRATKNKLEYLEDRSFLKKRNYWLNDYFKIIFNAKNKMRPIKSTYVVKDLSEENGFSTERVKRFSRLTRRKLLYKKYDETQIILLSQILQKASRRMGVDPDTETKAPFLTQEFSVLNENGERETYVETTPIDTQSQYNLARRLLRKDMTELQMMDVFRGLIITHEDIVMAAYETGYITVQDLEFVVKYDDLWNPEKKDFDRIVGFIGTVAGVSTMFLPPPWNITVSIAIGVIEGLVLSTRKNGANNDNPATFIE